MVDSMLVMYGTGFAAVWAGILAWSGTLAAVRRSRRNWDRAVVQELGMLQAQPARQGLDGPPA